MDDAADNSAVFTGATDTLGKIASAELFTLTSDGPFPGAFTMNQVRLVVEPLPGPGNLVLLTAALAGFGMTCHRARVRRRSRE
jgi:hypothetical protein